MSHSEDFMESDIQARLSAAFDKVVAPNLHESVYVRDEAEPDTNMQAMRPPTWEEFQKVVNFITSTSVGTDLARLIFALDAVDPARKRLDSLVEELETLRNTIMDVEEKHPTPAELLEWVNNVLTFREGS